MPSLRSHDFQKELVNNFNFSATNDQHLALQQIAEFCLELSPNKVFLLKGYAGTGKTTLIKTLVKSLSSIKRKAVLMAPTGRASKVMSQYSGRGAFTIHKYIYRPKRDKAGGMLFNLKENKASGTVYIVDEASMINDSSGDISSSLLSDLIQFVKTGVNCKLIFVGDIAQLPPIHTDVSPALDEQYLSLNYGLEPQVVELTQVMRQEQGSVLLHNSTKIRQMQILEDYSVPQLSTGADVIRLLEGYEIEDALNTSFLEVGREGTAVIVRSNKRAGLYNQQIRQRILWQEDEISAGDYLMVVKNNYFWLPEKSKANFIANGDIIELMEIYEIKELYDYRFARVKIRMVDYPDEEPFETIIFLDVLAMPSASLSWDESQVLYKKVLEDYAEIPSKYKQMQKVKENVYFNALQVKFAYAITCHKSQGGQWENVFVEKPWLPDGQISLDYLRWIYTAFTRAKSKLYLISFTDDYFRQ